MSTLILIPARMASTRLPGKPLADIAGAPMIVHVARRAAEAGLGRVVVATDTQSVAEAVRAHGFEAAMMPGSMVGRSPCTLTIVSTWPAGSRLVSASKMRSEPDW